MPSNNRSINPMSPSSDYENSHMSNSHHQRPHEVNQQIAKSTRPQLPRDGTINGLNTTFNGKMPSGYVSVWNFDGNRNTKDSATTKPGNAGKKSIF